MTLVLGCLLASSSACVDLSAPPPAGDAAVAAPAQSSEPPEGGSAPATTGEASGDGADAAAPGRDAAADAHDARPEPRDAPSDTPPDPRDAHGSIDAPAPNPDLLGGAEEAGRSGLDAESRAAGLIGHWRFDETDGTIAFDSSTSGATGTRVGAGAHADTPSLSFPDARSAIFDGRRSYVSIADGLLRPAALTLAVWVKLDAATTDTVCGFLNDPQVQVLAAKLNSRPPTAFRFEGYGLRKSATGFEFLAATADGVVGMARSSPAPAVGTWYHVAGTFDGRTLRLYVNGILAAAAPHPFPLDLGSAPLMVGRTGQCASRGIGTGEWDNVLHGKLDDLRLYDRALSDQEIARLAAGAAEP